MKFLAHHLTPLLLLCSICAEAASAASAISPLKASKDHQCVYTMYVGTGSNWQAGTDSTISISLLDRDGKDFSIPNLKIWGGRMGDNHNYFETGNLDIFSGLGPCMSSMPCSIKVISDGKGINHGWYCKDIEVTMTGLHLPCDQQLFTIEQWLANASPYKLYAEVNNCPPAGGGALGWRGLPNYEA